MNDHCDYCARVLPESIRNINGQPAYYYIDKTTKEGHWFWCDTHVTVKKELWPNEFAESSAVEIKG